MKHARPLIYGILTMIQNLPFMELSMALKHFSRELFHSSRSSGFLPTRHGHQQRLPGNWRGLTMEQNH